MAKEVRFDIYCKYCEFTGLSASNDPCNKCLGKPDNEGTKVPVLFKKAKPLVNYLIDGETLPDRYTRDPGKSRNWKAQIPTEAELKAHFELKNEDWFEKED